MQGENPDLKIAKRYNVFYYNLSDINHKLKFMIDIFPSLLKLKIEKEKEYINEYINKIKGQNDTKIFWELINDIAPQNITVVIENNYVDREYRDSYYTHYSEIHQEISRWCRRLLLFSEDQSNLLKKLEKLDDKSEDVVSLKNNFIGSIVIKPIESHAIGRTLINPTKLKSMKDAYVRLSTYRICYKDLELEVSAFPFRMQDEVITSCAEVSLLNIFDYYSSKYNQYAYLMPSNIHSIVRKIKPDRTIPVKGINYEVMSRVLYESGFAPKEYTSIEDHRLMNLKPMNPEILYYHPRNLLGYYVESGMPVGIGVHASYEEVIGHSIVCIGHADCIKIDNITPIPIFEDDQSIQIIDTNINHTKYIVQDDQDRPYSIMQKDNQGNCSLTSTDNQPLPLTVILVPLHRRMYMDAAIANAVFLQIISRNIKLDRKRGVNSYIGDSKNPLVCRTFLASSGHFRIDRLKYAKNTTLFKIYENLNMPHFIWVRELYSKETYPHHAIGEIILDATYSKKDVQAQLLYNFNGRLEYYYKEGKNIEILIENDIDIHPYSNLKHII